VNNSNSLAVLIADYKIQGIGNYALADASTSGVAYLGTFLVQTWLILHRRFNIWKSKSRKCTFMGG